MPSIRRQYDEGNFGGMTGTSQAKHGRRVRRVRGHGMLDARTRAREDAVLTSLSAVQFVCFHPNPIVIWITTPCDGNRCSSRARLLALYR